MATRSIHCIFNYIDPYVTAVSYNPFSVSCSTVDATSYPASSMCLYFSCGMQSKSVCDISKHCASATGAIVTFVVVFAAVDTVCNVVVATDVVDTVDRRYY